MIITGSGRVLAKVIDLDVSRDDEPKTGAHWFTEPADTLQFGILVHDNGYEVKPHTHGHPVRAVTDVVEVLMIVAGVYELTVFDEDRNPMWTGDVVTGFVVILYAGGHGLKCKKDGIIIETRQGPHLGADDKTYY